MSAQHRSLVDDIAEVVVDASICGLGHTSEEPKIQDDLYIRDYDKCVLCYKCVEACGDDAQHTYAIAVSGRGFDARISTDFDTVLPDSACVYCGNWIGVCPTGAIQSKTEFDMRPHPKRSAMYLLGE